MSQYNKWNEPKKDKLPSINVDCLSHMGSYSTLDYSYNTEYHHEKDCDEYCRCGQIVDVKIKNIKLDYVLETLVDKKRVSEIDQYCVDRVLRIFEAWNPNNWELEIDPEYYGQEVGNAKLDSNIINEIQKSVNHLQTLNTLTEKLFYVLELEYGYVLDQLKKDNFKLIEVDRNKIRLPQEAYVKKLKKANLEFYTKYTGPIGICIVDGDNKLRLMDGYHRFSATNHEKVQVFVPEYYGE